MVGRAGLREGLIAAALAMLESGNEEPSLRAVARRAGVSAMAPYRHFTGKADLLAAVADHGFEVLRGALVAADARPAPRDALFAQGMAFIDFARSHPALFRLMYGPQHGCAASAAGQAANDVLAARVATLVPDDVVAATLACRSYVQGTAMLVLGGRLSATEIDAVPAAMRLFVDGLGSGAPQT